MEGARQDLDCYVLSQIPVEVHRSLFYCCIAKMRCLDFPCLKEAFLPFFRSDIVKFLEAGEYRAHVIV